MKATGIVRRIDDLGRVVIPRELRRTLHIHEGDPLELFIDTDGSVTLKKYVPIGEKDCAKAKQILKAILPDDVDFALYDMYGDIRAFTSIEQFRGEYRIDRDNVPNGIYTIRDAAYDYDVVGYLYIKGEVEENVKQMAINVLTAFYKED